MPTVNRHLLKVLLLSVWILLLGAAVFWWLQSDVSLQQTPQMLEQWLRDFGLLNAALVYILLYSLRPLLFFPGSLLTISSGLLFGPWLGLFFTLIGANISANFAFLLARFLGRDWVQASETKLVHRWDSKLHHNGFITVLIMRLVYLPFDAVNYGCGLTAMKQRDYALGTFFGILPGTTTFVLLGGTFSAHADGVLDIAGVTIPRRAFVFGLSAFFFVLGLVISKYLKRTESAEQPRG